jgi:hypothetical protein
VSNSTPPSRSCVLAGCTIACRTSPKVSTTTWRFFPLTCFPASKPEGSLFVPLFPRSSPFDCQ